MDPKIFKDGNHVPTAISELVDQTGLEAMSPGETTWTVPWTLDVDEFGEISINAGSDVRNHEPGGTANLKIISDFDGIYIDATALSRQDVDRYFSHQPGKVIIGGNSDDKKPVRGVLYPYLTETDGIDPETVKTFNKEQRELRRQFGDYFKETYSHEYGFASDEYTGYRQIGGLGIVATSRQAEPQTRRRWGKRR